MRLGRLQIGERKAVEEGLEEANQEKNMMTKTTETITDEEAERRRKEAEEEERKRKEEEARKAAEEAQNRNPFSVHEVARRMSQRNADINEQIKRIND